MMIHFIKELITPARAKELLKTNTLNRALNKVTVNYYADQMRRGFWREDTGETIKISIEGNLIDGQHRLSAVVESGTTVPITIAYGVLGNVFDVLDTGKKRSHADVFSAKRIPYSALISAGVAFYYALKNSRTDTTHIRMLKLSSHDILSKYNENPHYWQDLSRFADTIYVNSFRTITKTFILGFTAYTDEFSRYACAREFFNDYKQMQPNHVTVRKLRERLISLAISKQSLTPAQKNALIIKAYNAFAEKKNLSVLKFTEQEAEYPKIV